MGPTSRLAEFVHEACFDEIPATVVQKAKDLILNVLGAMVAGSTEQTGKIGIELVREAGGEPQSTVVGGGFKTSAIMAALANGISAHATDQDDTDWGTLAHPTVAILPAILALGEHRHASGRQILESYILGVEAETRVGLAVGPLHQQSMGFHPTGTLGHVGATVACCRILGLTAKQIEMALGIMGSLASAIRHNVGSMTKPLHAGNAAKNGVLAARLAQRGFTSVENVLESGFGFGRVFGGTGANPDLFVKDLGRPYIIESPGITIKADPCGTYGSVLIQGLQEMIRDHGIAWDAVASIELAFNPELQNIMRYVHPKNALEAKYSITFVVAATLVERRVTLKEFTDEKTQDPRIQEVISRIKFIPHAPSESAHRSTHSGAQLSATQVTVRMKDGKEYSRLLNSAKGYVNQSFTGEEMLERYRDFAGLRLSAGQIDKSAEMANSLEHVVDIGSLMNLLR